MLWRRRPYDRYATLAAADRARARGRVKKAIALYRKVLAVDPGDLGVHAKLAPLLARSGQRAEALASFQLAAGGQLRAGFTERAIALHRQVVDAFPDELPAWEEITRLHLQRGRTADAVAVLVLGGTRLLRSSHLVIGARLLERARELEPWHPEATLVLARIYWRGRRRGDALTLLDGLSARTRGATLRQARRLAFFIRPTPAHLWRWVQAAWRASARPAPTPAPGRSKLPAPLRR
jgi:tetratricopeptide (TPR) repeat protein